MSLPAVPVPAVRGGGGSWRGCRPACHRAPLPLPRPRGVDERRPAVDGRAHPDPLPQRAPEQVDGVAGERRDGLGAGQVDQVLAAGRVERADQRRRRGGRVDRRDVRTQELGAADGGERATRDGRPQGTGGGEIGRGDGQRAGPAHQRRGAGRRGPAGCAGFLPARVLLGAAGVHQIQAWRSGAEAPAVLWHDTTLTGYTPRMADVQHINPEGLASNPAFTQVVRVPAGRATIYVGGQNGIDGSGNLWRGRTSPPRPGRRSRTSRRAWRRPAPCSPTS